MKAKQLASLLMKYPYSEVRIQNYEDGSATYLHEAMGISIDNGVITIHGDDKEDHRTVIYIDSVAGCSGTEPGVNGTELNPVDNYDDAKSLMDYYDKNHIQAVLVEL